MTEKDADLLRAGLRWASSPRTSTAATCVVEAICEVLTELVRLKAENFDLLVRIEALERKNA